MAAVGQIRDVLRSAARLQVAVLVGNPHHRLFVPQINPLRVAPWRIKRNSVRPLETRGEGFHLFRRAVSSDSAKNLDVAGVALGDEEISVRRGRDPARIIKVTRVKLHGKARERFWPSILGTGHHFGTVISGLRRKRLRKILNRNLAHAARFFVAIIGKWSLWRWRAGSGAGVRC